MTQPGRLEIDLDEGERLAAVASLWRKTARELRARFGGSSMEPALPPGTEVVLRCGETGGHGEVIAFLSHGRLLVHRVVARSPDGAWTLTRGDARLLPDVPIVDAEAVVGRIAGIWKGGSVVAVPAPPESRARRWVLAVAAAVVGASPKAGGAALASLHAASRWARTLAIVLRRPRDTR